VIRAPWASRETVTGTVATIADAAAARHLQPPAIAVVGQVAAPRHARLVRAQALVRALLVVTRPRALLPGSSTR
jgi:siroheme synthase